MARQLPQYESPFSVKDVFNNIMRISQKPYTADPIDGLGDFKRLTEANAINQERMIKDELEDALEDAPDLEEALRRAQKVYIKGNKLDSAAKIDDILDSRNTRDIKNRVKAITAEAAARGVPSHEMDDIARNAFYEAGQYDLAGSLRDIKPDKPPKEKQKKDIVIMVHPRFTGKESDRTIENEDMIQSMERGSAAESELAARGWRRMTETEIQQMRSSAKTKPNPQATPSPKKAAGTGILGSVFGMAGGKFAPDPQPVPTPEPERRILIRRH